MTRRTFALALAASATRARAADRQSRGRELIDKAIAALGGDVFRNMRTRTESGRAASFYHDRISSLSNARIYTKYLAKNGPEKLHEVQRQVYGKKQDDSFLYAPSGAFEITFRGARPLPEDRAEQFTEGTLHEVFYILHQRLNEPGVDFDAHGIDVTDNQRVEVIDCYDADNRNTTIWLNANTFLPVKSRYSHWDPIVKERREDVTRYTNYRSTAGLTWPHGTERERDTDKMFQLYADKVTIDSELADSFFELPAGITALKP